MNNASDTIKVWDIIIRVFHWALVLCFATAYFTGDEENPLHIYSGYAVLGLISFRVLWGFIGSQHARFKDFIFSPTQVIQYTKSLLKKKPKHFMGHNPLGGYMVIALLLSLFVVTLSGLKLYAVEEGRGPLAKNLPAVVSAALADDEASASEKPKNKNESGEELWEEIHEAAVNFTLFLIALHISGVIFSSRVEKENLIKAMITGKKNKLKS